MRTPRARPPISIRHAFGLAVDLAVRRDLLQSMVVPLLMRSPWALALALVPPFPSSEPQSPMVFVASIALIGDFLVMLVVGAMLRYRARSVFNTTPEVRPAPAGECYAAGLRRVPSLLVTEVVRNFSLALAASFAVLPTQFIRLRPEFLVEDVVRNLGLLGLAAGLALPALFLGFRLGVATEAVVLHERDLAGAFQRSFHMMRGHFERWLELLVSSVVLVLGLILLFAILSLGIPWLMSTAGLAVLWLLAIAVTPLIQYAWTFFYLRVVEIEQPGIEVGPAYAAANDRFPGARPTPPPLTLVPGPETKGGEERPA
jgi:hypothetical protein